MDERCVTGLEAVPAAARSGVLTIGNFDGVHVGHRRIIAMARERADADGCPVVAMTFDPPPDLVLRPADAPERLTPAAVRAALLREAGCDWVVTARADPALLGLTPEAFVEQVIVARFAPRYMVEGPNFRFGRQRGGDVDFLAREGARRGFDVRVAEPVRLAVAGEERVISSTLIRRLVAEGDVSAAARCLTRAFTLHGQVVPGEGIGRTLGRPTANLSPGEQVCPGEGVYAGRARVSGREYAAAVSVGTRPTFTAGDPAGRVIEAYLLDASGDFYGRRMALSFVRRLRAQRRYDGPAALQAQMARDVENVRAALADGG